MTSIGLADSPEAVDFCRAANDKIRHELARVIVGQDEVIDQILIAIFTRSHALLVGVPGLAKTLLISTLAKTLQMSFKRIQFTPDFMPSDITGTEVIYQDPASGMKEFKFLPGPIFSNVVLADEINRTPPKTQAAMLEAMQERSVTVGGTTRPLPSPFFVLATQNPLEQEGTYPLPEAQLDRFLFLVKVGYPTPEEEIAIMKRGTGGPAKEARPVLTAEHVLYIQDVVKSVPAADHIYEYAAKIVQATRVGEAGAMDHCQRYLSFGAGPRASIGLIMAAKAHAILRGRLHAACEDVAAVAKGVMRHRVAVNFTAQSEGIDPDKIIDRVLRKIPAH